jgi:predicted esterase
MKTRLAAAALAAGFVLLASPSPRGETFARDLKPGAVIDIPFDHSALPPTLYETFTGGSEPPGLQVRLPDDYTPARNFPVLVYVPGYHGGPKGNLGNATAIAGPKGWIAASLPLFKKTLDRGEPSGGLPVSFEDYPVVSQAYRIMLDRLYETIPNTDRDNSAMVGFSNGALTIAVLVSCHDGFILSRFRNFCLVDHGMAHLTDLHKSGARESRFLILAGDREDYGRSLKIRGAELRRDEWKLLGVDVDCRILEDTGHEFETRHMELVGRWLRREPLGVLRPRE